MKLQEISRTITREEVASGNDHVNADAQDGGGTNNANFATPPDGISGKNADVFMDCAYS